MLHFLETTTLKKRKISEGENFTELPDCMAGKNVAKDDLAKGEDQLPISTLKGNLFS